MTTPPEADVAAGDVVEGLVSTIVPVHDRPTLFQEAVESVLAQTYQQFELILVDDGSGPETAELCAAYAAGEPRIVLLRPPPRHRPGLAREAGRRVARGEFLQYLDSDDLLAPRKFEVMTRALRERPESDVAYCATRRYTRGEPPADVATERTGEAFEHLLPSCLAGRPWHTCTPIYTRRISDRAGAWSGLRFWEDVEYDLRVALLGARLVHCPELLADFRDHDQERLSRADFFRHADSMREAPAAYRLLAVHAARSGVRADHPAMRAFLTELRSSAESCRALGLDPEWLELERLREGLELELRDAAGDGARAGESRGNLERVGHSSIRGWAAHGALGATVAIYVNGRPVGVAEPTVERTDVTEALGVEPVCGFACELPRPHVSGQFPRWLRTGDVVAVRFLDGTELPGSPQVHRARPVSLGDLASTPFTDDWGFSRGLPVDRTYVEEFLAANAGEIRGRVLEIGDADYTARFGGDRVLRADVLDLRDHPGVTHVGDLQDAPMLEDGVYDCVVLTQVLVLIPDLARALATVQRILRPGGVALITNPGISQVSHDPSEAAAWHWALYPRSLQRLLVGAGFPAKTIEIGSWGNLKATVAFLAGLASSDLEPAELSFRDPRYPLLVSAKAVKSPRSAAAGASTH